MAAYKLVHSPDGEPRYVPTARANELILQHGWTQQPPVAAEPEPAPEPAPKKSSRSRKKKEEETPAVDEATDVPLEDFIDFTEPSDDD